VARDEVKSVLNAGALEMGSVEIGTIAETEHDEDEVDDETKTEIRFKFHYSFSLKKRYMLSKKH
jgi:hypothetical protein